MNDMQVLFEHVGAGIFMIHTGDDRNVELFFYSLGNAAAGNAVTSSIECRAGNKSVCLLVCDHAKQCLGSCCQVFTKIAVSADDCSNDFIIVTQSCLQRQTRSYCSRSALGRNVRLFFSTDPGKEVVDVMNDSLLFHSIYLLLLNILLLPGDCNR